MSLKGQAVTNIGSSWFGLGVNVIVGFFLSPFILHKLGDDAFGLWVLIFSLTGYYGLFDLGIRSSIVKYVSSFVATRDYDELSRTVNTAVFSYSCVALVLMLVSAITSRYVNVIFHISPGFVHTARVLFLMVGSAVAIGFPLSVFAGILEGLQKFYVLNLTQVGATLIRATLIVIVLERGFGLIAIAFITVSLAPVSYCSYIVIVRHLLPVRFGLSWIDRKAFRRIANYGSLTFIAQVAGRLRFQTDAAVIGIFLSASAITHYAIGSRLVDYSSGFVDNMGDIFLPMSSHFDATGEKGQLRKILVLGNRACALVMFPICVTLLALGKSVISVWVGPKYLSSYLILVLLLLPRTLLRAQAASTRILFGMAHHRLLAWVTLTEGCANLALSVVLVHYYGIVGVAVGTTIPLFCTTIFFLPLHLCRLLEIRIRSFLKEAYVLPLVFCIPQIAVLLAIERLFRARTYPELLVQVLAGAFAYGIGVFWLFLTREPAGVRLRLRFAEYLQQSLGR